MKLKDFIKELVKIEKISDDSSSINVKMADNIPVVKPIFNQREKVVYITDVDPYLEQINELLNP
ncbi:MAG: hypothetical protein A3D35_03635 [Candidatus Staskawiczbacteria bacterium RIFCSPHIGHO2_02_FULL_34_9]|uniref:Uncharacterized protein n=1 Tax=Candidatus Staskawiczbacteria bacterium RIFCSPHIGHO2_02_FULL_34_9 TaxID=1802206 RepID=A0A1G2HXB0_9BACT|nr:MAG: hypothetical protein A3D35_03635 [Candidatus Staskawiczbacteria bacterium RIFCSPHIGHO2_02_FULL_34_9]